MKTNRFLSICFVLLVTIVNVVNGQEFFSGTKGTNTIISRTGRTTLGYALFRSSSDGTQVLEHSNNVGNFYIRSVGYQIADDTGNLILNDIGGSVGIGTANPKAKLAVNGNILAKEIKVKTDITVPDYVFEDTYNLPSLSSVESYVREHKHLPEIPSAKDIERDGLDLAEMNLLLLKKVEELTLHLIEKEKEVTGLKNGMYKMEERIYRLENKN